MWEFRKLDRCLFSNAVSLIRVLYLVFYILFEVIIFLSFETVCTVIFRKEKREKI